MKYSRNIRKGHFSNIAPYTMLMERQTHRHFNYMKLDLQNLARFQTFGVYNKLNVLTYNNWGRERGGEYVPDIKGKCQCFSLKPQPCPSFQTLHIYPFSVKNLWGGAPCRLLRGGAPCGLKFCKMVLLCLYEKLRKTIFAHRITNMLYLLK